MPLPIGTCTVTFTGSGNNPRTLYVVEKRDDDGTLLLDEPQPPSEWGKEGVSANTLFQHYFAHNPDGDDASQKQVLDWLATKQWRVRVKVW